MEQLAAREVRRYVYLRTGPLLPMVTEPQGGTFQRETSFWSRAKTGR